MKLTSFNNKVPLCLVRCCCSTTVGGGKSFQEIPGPKQLPVLGNSLLFSPLGIYCLLLSETLKWITINSFQTGPYTTDKLLMGFADLQKQFGDIVKMKMGNLNSVLVFNPEDVRTMFHHEGHNPRRPVLEALKKYRKESYGCAGIVPE